MSSRTKIGLSISLGLGIVLAVGVARRLMRSTPAAATPLTVGSERPGVRQTESQELSWMAAKPAVLTPAGPPSTAPKPALDDAGWWTVTPEVSRPNPAAGVPVVAAAGRGHAAEGAASLLGGADYSPSAKDALGPDDLAARQPDSTQPGKPCWCESSRAGRPVWTVPRWTWRWRWG